MAQTGDTMGGKTLTSLSLDPKSINNVGQVVFRGSFSDGSVGIVLATLPPELSVVIDLKPGSNPNCVNPDGSGEVSVAIFGSDTFDVADINQLTLQFGGAAPRHCAIEDARMEGPTSKFKKDKISDLVCQFVTQGVTWPDGGSDCGTATLTGQLNDGTPIRGSDNACLAGEATCNARTPIPVP